MDVLEAAVVSGQHRELGHTRGVTKLVQDPAPAVCLLLEITGRSPRR